MYKAVIFDVGDTLVHYEPDRESVISEILKLVGSNVTDNIAKKIDRNIEACIVRQIYRETQGDRRIDDNEYENLIDEAVIDVLNEFGLELDEVQRRDFRKVRNGFTCKKVIDPEIYSLLGKLQKTYKLGIVSNYTADLVDYLKDQKLSGYFSSVIVSQVVGVEKPDRRIFDMSVKELEYDPSDCLYVGDHPFDVVGAVGAGMDVAWLNLKFDKMPSYILHKPTYVLSDIMELNDIL